jgi:hypothetical protein
MGTGSAVVLASELHSVLAKTGTPMPVPRPTPAPGSIDTATIFGTLGLHGRTSGPVAQVGVLLLSGPVSMDGGNIPPALGLVSPLNFQAVAAERLVATGDFAVTGDRVDPLIRALARNRITATAAHSHMIGETPVVYFIHFWADGTPAAIARGLREALDAAR